MKVISGRAAVLLIFIAAFLAGIVFFTFSFALNASAWVKYPANQHLYVSGQPKVGTITDRNGTLLAKTSGGKRVYNGDAAIRTAMMHAVGDSNGDVATGAQVVFAEKMSGWNLLDGTFTAGRSGKDIRLTLDAELCSTAYQALNGRRGAVGVYNYKTGEIVCMASSPSFDPQNPPTIKSDTEKYKGVYINRLLSATYTPGSTFKLVTAAAAIDNIKDIFSESWTCTGSATVGGGKLSCPEVHGTENFAQALTGSCNVAFGQIAVKLGNKTLEQYADKAGFNSSLNIDGITTAAGKINLKSADKLSLAWAGVGQSADTVNPAAMMAYVGAIANGGVRVNPRLLTTSASAQSRILSASTAAKLGDMMRANVTNGYGDDSFPGLSLCAKTGTAEINGQQPDSWFVGYMSRADCPLAFVVVVENGGWGISTAGPIANTVLQQAVKKFAK
jgi:peptidoglycan glycosyltransferase